VIPEPVQRWTGPYAVAHSVQKWGRSATENEDSFAFDPGAGRFAVADGASTSARSEVWSRLLVECFVREREDPMVPEALNRLRSRWHGLVTAKADLPWYARAKLVQGAHSTFLSLLLDTANDCFHAVAVGDSCYFHIRGNRIMSVGPVEGADDFDRFPVLVGSRPESSLSGTRYTGLYRAGDIFVLATDAMAKFVMTVAGRHGRIPPVTDIIGSPPQFVRAILRWRARRLLDNDDTTMCVVRV
jgi:Protein phosphatase 2C